MAGEMAPGKLHQWEPGPRCVRAHVARDRPAPRKPASVRLVAQAGADTSRHNCTTARQFSHSSHSYSLESNSVAAAATSSSGGVGEIAGEEVGAAPQPRPRAQGTLAKPTPRAESIIKSTRAFQSLSGASSSSNAEKSRVARNNSFLCLHASLIREALILLLLHFAY